MLLFSDCCLKINKKSEYIYIILVHFYDICSPRTSKYYFSRNQSVVKFAFALYPMSVLLWYCFPNTNALLMDSAVGKQGFSHD